MSFVYLFYARSDKIKYYDLKTFNCVGRSAADTTHSHTHTQHFTIRISNIVDILIVFIINYSININDDTIVGLNVFDNNFCIKMMLI